MKKEEVKIRLEKGIQFKPLKEVRYGLNSEYEYTMLSKPNQSIYRLNDRDFLFITFQTPVYKLVTKEVVKGTRVIKITEKVIYNEVVMSINSYTYGRRSTKYLESLNLPDDVRKSLNPEKIGGFSSKYFIDPKNGSNRLFFTEVNFKKFVNKFLSKPMNISNFIEENSNLIN